MILVIFVNPCATPPRRDLTLERSWRLSWDSGGLLSSTVQASISWLIKVAAYGKFREYQ
jgi:hypothetical protein